MHIEIVKITVKYYYNWNVMYIYIFVKLLALTGQMYVVFCQQFNLPLCCLLLYFYSVALPLKSSYWLVNNSIDSKPVRHLNEIGCHRIQRSDNIYYNAPTEDSRDNIEKLKKKHRKCINSIKFGSLTTWIHWLQNPTRTHTLYIFSGQQLTAFVGMVYKNI